MRSIAQVLMVGTVCLCSTHVFAQGTPSPTRTPDASAQQLRRDLEIMKEQMRQMQDKIRQQEEAIEKLSTPAAAPLCRPPAPVPAPPAAGDREQLKQEVREEVMRDIQPKLSAANKTFPSQFNPAISLVLDSVFSYREHEGRILTSVLPNSVSLPRSIPLRAAMPFSTDHQMALRSKRRPSSPPRYPIIWR